MANLADLSRTLLSRSAGGSTRTRGGTGGGGAISSTGGGGGGQFGGLFKQIQKAQKKANEANEARFQAAMKQFEGLGQAGEARIARSTEQRQGAATQNLTSRGLGSTTITSAVERGIAGDAETQRQELGERVAVQKAGLLERKTDLGPDLGMFVNLLQAAGQGQAQQSRSVISTVAPRTTPGFLTKIAQQRATNVPQQRARAGLHRKGGLFS